MRKYSSNLAFVDLLFNLILGFVFLFVVSFLLINDPTKKDNVEEKKESPVEPPKEETPAQEKTASLYVSPLDRRLNKQ